ncbi:nicolin-1 isoform X1 [Hydra vulgaris]|uniref:nicolin-1 isoform X1 n=1 Tax=Hydra vulgaris TaxID=6087 RepID=UPI001F5EB1D7|nr:nicolin-1-like isoform X1 [Hydra vulgaris]XP_047130914.1 nicolin-1-like isoform X1 [Hydra vulgaris]
MEEIEYTEYPIKLISLDDETIPGCGVIDISFKNVSGTKVAKLSFQNNYTSFITIKGKSVTGNFKTLLKNFRLMQFCHYADDSQNFFLIKSEDLCCNEPLIGLKFILRQPSPQWRCFNIKDIKIYRSTSKINKELEDKPL